MDKKTFSTNGQKYLDWFMRKIIQDIKETNNRKSLNENALELYEIKTLDQILRFNKYLNKVDPQEQISQANQLDRENLQKKLKYLISQIYLTGLDYNQQDFNEFLISHSVFLLCVQKNYAQFSYKASIYQKNLSKKQLQIMFTLFNEYQNQINLYIFQHKNDSIYEKSIQSVITFDDQINTIEDLIVEAIEHKLNILFIMKQKYIDLIQLQNQLKILQIKRREIISFIQNIIQLNFFNAKLQNLLQIYLKTIAFTDKDFKLNDKNANKNQCFNKILNQYARNEEACVILSQFKNEKEQIIKNVSHNFKRVFNCNQNDFVGQSINKLMPEPYGRVHQKYVENYINTQNNTTENQRSFLAFALTQNKYISPIQLEIKLNTSLNFQLSTEFGFALYLQKINKQKQYILYDSNIFEVVSISEQIHQNIFNGYQDYTKLNLLSFFPIICRASNCAQKSKQSQLDSKTLPNLQMKKEDSSYSLQKMQTQSQINNIQKNNFHLPQIIENIQEEGEIQLQIDKESQQQFKNQSRVYQTVEGQLIQQNFFNQHEENEIGDILNIKYLLVLESEQKLLMSKQKSLKSQQIKYQKRDLIHQYKFYILQFDIKSVKSTYLTHLKYLEISKYQQLNPINSASLILSFCNDKYKRTNLSNVDHLQDQQVEDLFQDLVSFNQTKSNICDRVSTQSPGSKSQQQCNSSCQNADIKLETTLTQDYLDNKKYEKRDEFNYQNSFFNSQDKHKNDLLVNSTSFDIRESIQYQEQPLLKFASYQNVKQLENYSYQNICLNSQSKNLIPSFQFRGKNFDCSIDNLSQTQRYNFSQNICQDAQISQISERIFRNKGNSPLLKQDLNVSQIKEHSQFKFNFNNFDLINSTESDSYATQFQNNIVNLKILTQSQTQIQSSQSFMQNANQHTLQKHIYQNQNKISSKKNDKQKKSKNNSQRLKSIFNKAKNLETASNSSKCSSSSKLKQIERKILSEKRQLTIQLVNWFGILSLIVLSVVIIKQFFSINLLIGNFQSDFDMIGWPTGYMDSISLIVKNSNLQKLLQKGYIYIQGGDTVKHTMKNQSQNEIIFAINQIKNLINQMELNTNQLSIFKNIIEKPNIFRFGANFNPYLPLNIQPADTYYQLIDIEMGLFYSLELIILYLFRFAYGLGLGSGQFITLSNKLPISKQLSTISQQNISEMADKVSSIQENMLSILITLIVVVFCIVFLTLPLYSITQVKKQKFLQLFGTFHSDMIQMEINKIDEQLDQDDNKQLKNLKYLINQQVLEQKNLNQEKKQSISSTSQLQKFNLKIICLATIIFIITLPYPIVIQNLCKDYISQSKVVLQIIKSIYEMEQLVIENTGLHYFCIYLKISPNTVPYSYENNRQEVQQNIISANSQNTILQASLSNLKAAKLFNRNQFDEFFFKIFESDICQLMKNNMNLFVSGFDYNSEECNQIYNGRFSQGLMIALQQYFSYFPDLFQIYEISEKQMFQQKFDKYQKDLDFEQFYKLEKYLVVILKSLSKFILNQTNQYESYLKSTLAYLLIYQFFLFGIIFYFGQRKFMKVIESELRETKQSLSILNINFLLQNAYVKNFIKKNI
ncbi:hypothetical protein ABPG72_003321 [Tetrahymena utriculariae]